MPADAFALPVFVRRQKELVSTLQRIFQFTNCLFLVLGNHVKRFEIGLSVDTQVGPFLPLRRCRDLAGVVGQITDMPHGGFDLEALGEKAANRPGLRRALNDDEGVRHRKDVNRAPSLSHRPPQCMGKTSSEVAEERRYSHPETLDPTRSCPTWVHC